MGGLPTIQCIVQMGRVIDWKMDRVVMHHYIFKRLYFSFSTCCEGHFKNSYPDFIFNFSKFVLGPDTPSVLLMNEKVIDGHLTLI